MAYGLPWDAALAALTTVPARIWGIADRYGTLEPGKDADVVVWTGDPLERHELPRARSSSAAGRCPHDPPARAARPLQGRGQRGAAGLPPALKIRTALPGSHPGRAQQEHYAPRTGWMSPTWMSLFTA